MKKLLIILCLILISHSCFAYTNEEQFYINNIYQAYNNADPEAMLRNWNYLSQINHDLCYEKCEIFENALREAQAKHDWNVRQRNIQAGLDGLRNMRSNFGGTYHVNPDGLGGYTIQQY